MNDLLSYERLILQKNEGTGRWKMIGLIFLYVSWFSLWTLLMLRIGINAPMIAFIPLTTVLLILLTWKYTHVEFEYTLVDGTLLLDKIYGKKTRKNILEAELRQALLIAPDTADNRKKADGHTPTKVIEAISSQNAENVWLVLFEETPENRILVFLEADEPMLRIFRHYNPRVTARDRLNKTQP